MRDRGLMLDREQDKETIKILRAVKHYNHELAKEGKEYDRNIEVELRFDGRFTSLLRVNNSKETSSFMDISEIGEITEDKFTKQFRHLMYIVRRIREYNEIEGIDAILVLYYTGDRVKIVKASEPFEREILWDIDLMSMPYNHATRALSRIPQNIKTMGGKL